MSAKAGWRVHEDGGCFAASMCADGIDLFTLSGFKSRLEAAQFIAFYLVLVGTARHDEEFAGRSKYLRRYQRRHANR